VNQARLLRVLEVAVVFSVCQNIAWEGNGDHNDHNDHNDHSYHNDHNDHSHRITNTASSTNYFREG
jgi:hypothetical protein